MESARDHLTPDGAFAMYNYYREPWLVDRLADPARPSATRRAVSSPQAVSLAVLVAGLTPADQLCEATWAAAAYAPAPRRMTTRSCTCRRRRFSGDSEDLPGGGGRDPAVARWRSAWPASPFRAMCPYPDLFLLGAAFLLLETKNVSFRTLLRHDLAGQCAGLLRCADCGAGRGRGPRRLRTPPPLLMYLAAVGGLVMAWLVPAPCCRCRRGPAHRGHGAGFPADLLRQPDLRRALRLQLRSNIAFGANLLGAMVGGVWSTSRWSPATASVGRWPSCTWGRT